MQYSSHHVLPISLLCISLSGGVEVFGVRDIDRHSRRAGCRVAEAAAIIRETQSFGRRYQLCINVNERHFQQLL